MKTLCPTCKTRYDIDPKALLEADGLARCFRCGTVFDAVAEDALTPGATYTGPVPGAVALQEQAERPHGDAAEALPEDTNATPHPGREPADAIPEPVYLDEETGTPAAQPPPTEPAIETRAEAEGTADVLAVDGAATDTPAPVTATRSPAPRVADLQPDPTLLNSDEEPLPFKVPEDLTPLQPSPDVALDVTDTLYEKKSRRGLVYAVIAVLLISGLGMQLAWQHRKDLLRQYPVLAPLCDHIPCFPQVIHAPGRIGVMQRDIKPAANDPRSLTLSATIRNDADIAQHLPDIQLSLLDNNGAVLIRRRLSPSDYLFPAPADDRVMAPGEVVTITLDFEDPGHEASGFVLDFL